MVGPLDGRRERSRLGGLPTRGRRRLSRLLLNAALDRGRGRRAAGGGGGTATGRDLLARWVDRASKPARSTGECRVPPDSARTERRTPTTGRTTAKPLAPAMPARVTATAVLATAVVFSAATVATPAFTAAALMAAMVAATAVLSATVGFAAATFAASGFAAASLAPAAFASSGVTAGAFAPATFAAASFLAGMLATAALFSA